jgi:restriction system protein
MVFALLRWVGPAFAPGTAAGNGLTVAIAPVVALVLLAPALISIVRSILRKRLLDGARDAEAIAGITWHQFEVLVATAFRRIGYRVGERGGLAPDGGVDLVLYEDDKKTLVQCKHWKKKQVGVDVVRQLCGVMTAERAVAGIVVTGGSFTTEAQAFAARTGIDLVNGESLQTLLSYARGEVARDALPQAPRAPQCPLCAKPMVLRTSNRGSTQGSRFWGCSKYPSCSGTRAAEAEAVASV